jgi:eukaryotic-like serine/threonine-protein kinase
MDSSANNAAAPRYLGRYELVQLLGQGGMGEVFLAKISGAAGFEKPCIVKTVLPALLKDRQFLDRFHHEAKVLVHLGHSSIAQVYDMGEAEGVYYMALEYVAGVDLAYLQEQARARGEVLPVPVALYLGQHMCEGLGYAHRKVGPDGQPLGIVHRDVSPHNVMLSYEGEVKVIDFGLAKSAARSKYTLPSTVMGKLGYMSPEQVRGEAVDHRSDIYSCGVVVWELLAGQPLFASGTVGEMMAAMSHPVVPALHALRSDVDPALDAVVRRALAPHPEERYARADEFARALSEQLLRGGSSLGAEEVGEFVRALCPEAFASQRQLASQLTSSPGLRRTPSPGALTPAGSVVPLNTGPHTPLPSGSLAYASTLVRSPGSDASIPEARGRGRKGKWVVAGLGVFALVVVTAGATAMLVTQAEEHARPEPPPPAWAHADGPPAYGPPAYGPPGPPPPRHEPPPPLPPPFGGPPPPEEAQALVEPPPESSAPRPVPSGNARPSAPGGRLVAAPSVAALRRGADDSYVLPARSAEGLTPGMVLPVVASPVREGKARYLGEATVRQVSARGAVLMPDAQLRGAGKAARLAVLPTVIPAKFSVPETPPAQATPVAETPKGAEVAEAPAQTQVAPKPRELSGRINQRNLGPFRKKIELTNTDSVIWSACILVARGREMYKLGGISPGGTREVSLNDFKAGGREVPFVEQNRLGLFCAEGQRLFPVKL